MKKPLWYIANEDAVREGEIEHIEQAIDLCMTIKDDGRKFFPIPGQKKPWFVKRLGEEWYSYTSPTRQGANSVLWIGTKAAMQANGFGDKLAEWEKDHAEYLAWKKEKEQQV